MYDVMDMDGNKENCGTITGDIEDENIVRIGRKLAVYGTYLCNRQHSARSGHICSFLVCPNQVKPYHPKPEISITLTHADRRRQRRRVRFCDSADWNIRDMLVAPPPLYQLQAKQSGQMDQLEAKQRVLDSQRDQMQVKECANGRDCDAQLLVNGPDCSITDPGMDRLDTEVTNKMSAISLHPPGASIGSNCSIATGAALTDNVALLSNCVNNLEIKDFEP